MKANPKSGNAGLEHLGLGHSNLFRVSGFGFRASRKGFTLLELLAVLAILAVLIGLGAKGGSLARREAKVGRAKADIGLIRNALEEFRVQYGQYPEMDVAGGIDRLPELGFLTNAVPDIALEDPWGNYYQYYRGGHQTNRFLYRIWSKGADPGSDADDIDPSKPGY